MVSINTHQCDDDLPNNVLIFFPQLVAHPFVSFFLFCHLNKSPQVIFQGTKFSWIGTFKIFKDSCDLCGRAGLALLYLSSKIAASY